MSIHQVCGHHTSVRRLAGSLRRLGPKALAAWAGRAGRVLPAFGAAVGLTTTAAALDVAAAGGQALPRPGVTYPVTVRFNVYSRPDSASRVVGFINPGRSVVAVRTTPGGWTEIRWPWQARGIGYAHLTVGPPGRTPPTPGNPTSVQVGHRPGDRVRVYWTWILGGAAVLVPLAWLMRRWDELPWTGPDDALRHRPPSTREVIAVQVKWRDPQSFLGSDVVHALDGALRGYKLEERGAAQDARGVIVTPARMGDSGRRAAVTLDVLCEEGLALRVPSRIAALPPRRRNRAIGRWYEDQVARWYRSNGFAVDHRGRRLGRADGGIDLICRPL